MEEALRRQSVYEGDFHLFTQLPESLALVAYAQELIAEAFGDIDPERAQFSMEREEFVRRVAPLKSKFTNSQKTKELCRHLVLAMGDDPEETYFDLPRLRAIPSDNYLTTGVSYAYKAHRDTWYAHPRQLINYWVPVFDVTGQNVMSMYVGYFKRPVANESAGWDYDDWVKNARFQAEQNIGAENRNHPIPTEPIDGASEIRIAGRAGDIMMFSTCHLHASAPNTSGVTRFSFDLRTLNIRDLVTEKGPANIDGFATGSTLGDFLKISDLSPLVIEEQRHKYSVLA